MLNKNVAHIFNSGQEPAGLTADLHMIACFVIDNLVVENSAYSIEFFNMFNNSIVLEEEYFPDTEEIDVSLTDKNSGEKQYIRLNERLASIMLSSPKFIAVPEDSLWVAIGSKYIDGVFYP
jgi:hypothetical protein